MYIILSDGGLICFVICTDGFGWQHEPRQTKIPSNDYFIVWDGWWMWPIGDQVSVCARDGHSTFSRNVFDTSALSFYSCSTLAQFYFAKHTRLLSAIASRPRNTYSSPQRYTHTLHTTSTGMVSVVIFFSTVIPVCFRGAVAIYIPFTLVVCLAERQRFNKSLTYRCDDACAMYAYKSSLKILQRVISLSIENGKCSFLHTHTHIWFDSNLITLFSLHRIDNDK